MQNILRIRTRAVVLALLAVLALGGVSASCDEGGMYQGPGDSAPRWR